MKHSHIFIYIIFLFYSSFCFAQNNPILSETLSASEALSTDFLNAAEKGDSAFVKKILSRNDIATFINLGDMEGYTALMIASEMGHKNIVDMILSKNPNIDLASIYGKTALIYACEKGYIDIVMSLLAKKANPNIQINGGVTALLQASGRGYYKITEILLNAKANPEKVGMYIEGNGKLVTILPDMTPLMVAAYNNHLEVSSLILSKKVETGTINEYGASALFYAIGRKNNVIALKLMEYKTDVNITASYKAYINISPLALASALGSYELISPLFIAKANANQKMTDGRTVLIWAVIGGNINIVRDIIAKKPDVNVKDNEGKTALMYAAEYGNVDIAKLLIQNKANINDTDMHGKNALSYAMENGYNSMVEFLSEESLK